MADVTDRERDVEKLRDLIKDVKVAMLTTEEQDGTLRSRPMATQQTEFDGDLWFFTSAGSPKVDEVRRNRRVNVSYADPNDQHYVSVSGTAELVTDRRKMKELWSPLYKAWFPDGLDQPDLALLKVHVEQAEYWDLPSGKAVALAGFVKSLVTGKRFEGGEDRKVEL